MQLYFAYGSNLDLARMHGRCPTAHVVGPARLEGFELRFSGHSRRWHAGTATIVPACGEVLGLLDDLDEDALRCLDATEGVPKVYSRTRYEVITDRGDVVEAEVYVLPASRKANPPDPDYVRLVLHGLRRCGHPTDGVLAATRPEEQDLVGAERALFVCGTLMRGEPNAGHLHRAMNRPGFIGDRFA